MAKIKQIEAHEILNAKGEPTIETTVILSDGKTGRASCPSGGLIGSYEASDLRDRDKDRYNGLGVLKAISNVNEVISPSLLGMDATKQREIDKKMIELDGTANKGKLGANAILSVSMAVCKAAAKSSVLPLFLYLREYIKKEGLPLKIPTPIFSIINGGRDLGADFNGFLIIPASSKSYTENILMINKIQETLKNNLKTENYSSLFSDRGGFAPFLPTNEEGLVLLKQASETENLRLGFDVFLGLDVSANSFYHDQKYHIKDRSSPLSSSDLISFYETLNKKFNLLYLEDPLYEEDWVGWSQISSKISNRTLVVGDNLTVTNPYRLQMALDKKAITGIVIKPIQIGTVIEALAVVEIAREAGLKIVVSARTAETNDDFIADFAVAVSSDYVKLGGITRGELIQKYNRLFQIEKQIKSL